MPTHCGPVIAERDGLRVIQCSECGWAHLWPMPEMPADYYEKDFWATKGKGWLQKYEAEQDWQKMRHGDWLSIVEQHVTHRHLLDVGCGYGFFMLAAIESGWQVVGVEPSTEARVYANQRGLPVWSKMGLVKGQSDCITAMWLMEHLQDPLAFLVWCREHLVSGGVLLVAVPNEWNFYQTRANEQGKCKPNFWLHASHISYWSAATFSNLLGRSGFRVIDSLATYPIELALLYGQNYTEDDGLGDLVHADIRQKELALTRKDRVEKGRQLAREGVGRDLVLICKAD